MANAVATTHVISTVGGDGPAALTGPDATLVALADIAPSSRIIVVLPGALDLACGLMHLGCASVAMVRLTDRPRAGQADVVIIPHAACAGQVCRAVSFARRVLTPLGTAAICLDGDTAVEAAHEARHQFRTLGFAAIRQRAAGAAILLRADLPLFGLRQCA